MIYPIVYSVPEIFAAHGVEHAIIAPGSRNAPLTIAFARNKHIKCHSIPDERSAAFIALGMALQTDKPVVLICTSGSAALNFAPAVAEAFYSNVPLIVLTADRPPEWIGQFDGQTIQQNDIFGKHVKKSLTTPTDLNHEDAQWHFQRIVNEAALDCMTRPFGPTHINFPFREPIYPLGEIEDRSPAKIIKSATGKKWLSDTDKKSLQEKVSTFNRKVIVVGQGIYESEIIDRLTRISTEMKIPVVGDIISNIHGVDEAILHSDIFLGSTKMGLGESLKPDLLITIGGSVLAKNLKLTLRNHPAGEHWHVQPAGGIVDTFQSLTKVINCETEDFLSLLSEKVESPEFESQKQENYYHIWQIEERKTQRLLNEFFPHSDWGEFEFIQRALEVLPRCNLHLANSMSVRYANFIGLKNRDITVYSNRGTSGIDGSNSTAVGHAITSDYLNVLITGDLAFLYDRNAFWNNESFPNLRIIVINNHGGGIFRMIKGPASQPELEEFFETRQNLKAKSVADEFGYEYLFCDKKSKIKNYLIDFYDESDRPKILEIETEGAVNQQILKEFKQAFNKLS